MAGGFGGGSFGGEPFGSQEDTFVDQEILSETVTVTENVYLGESEELAETVFVAENLTLDNQDDFVEAVAVSESLAVEVPFEVQAAVSVGATFLRVDFTSIYDSAHAANLLAASYSIPGLTVYSVAPHPTLIKSVLLSTDPQQAISYTLTVDTSTQGIGGDAMSPSANTAVFNGFGLSTTFFAAAQAIRKVQVVFSSEMTIDAAFVDPLNYTITKIDGTSVTVNSVALVGNEDRHAELILGTDLDAGGYYSIRIDTNVQTVDGQAITPDTDVFQWAFYAPSPIAIAFEKFTGEVSTGLLGEPAGQVFFSPALEQDAANSILEVDEVSVCTRAYDVYEFPEPLDPPILYTYPAPDTPLTSHTLGSSTVLFASAERLGLARVMLHDLQEDTLPSPEEVSALATLVETIDITRAGFLNDVRWETYPAATAAIGVFTIADNLTPIGPGPTTAISLTSLISSLDGLVAWLHADDAVASGSDLTAWAPRAGTALGQAAAGISATAPQVVTRSVNGWNGETLVQLTSGDSSFVYWDSLIGAAAAGVNTPILVCAEVEIIDTGATGTIGGWTVTANSNNDRLTFGLVSGRGRMLRRKTVSTDDDDYSTFVVPVGQRVSLIYEYDGTSLRETLRGHGGGRNLHPSSTTGSIDCVRFGIGACVDGTPDSFLSMYLRQIAIINTGFLTESVRESLVVYLGDSRPYTTLTETAPTVCKLVMGQSNAAGIGLVSALSGGSYTPRYDIPFRALMNRNSMWDWGPHNVSPSTTVGDISTLHGPDVGMVAQYDTEGVTGYAILKHAHGGTELESDWLNGGAEAEDLPIFITESLNTNVYSLAAGLTTFDLVWIQGETDAATEVVANNYAANYEDLEDNIEAALGTTLRKAILVRLHKDNSALYADNVRAQQKAIVLADRSKRLLVVPDHLTLTVDHYQSAASLALGALIARADTDDSWCTLRADALVTTGTFAWDLYRGYNNVLASAVAGPAAPTISTADADFNGLDVLSFNGTSSGVRLDEVAAELESANVLTIVMRVKIDAAASGKTFVSFTQTGSNTVGSDLQLSAAGGTGQLRWRVQDEDSNIITVNTGWTLDMVAAHTIAFTLDWATKKITTFRVDGTETASNLNIITAGSITVDRFSLGYRAATTASSFTDCRFAEVRVYNSTRTTAQFQRDEAELSAVWS